MMKLARKLKRISTAGLSVLALVAWPTGAAAQVPGYLDILSATLEELPPIDPRDAAGRMVRLRIETSAPPICNSGTTFLAYGLLVDSDQDATTGLTGLAYADLGVDASLDVHCEASTSEFVSSAGGTVSVITDTAKGVTVIESVMPITGLPSLQFSWVGFAQENTILVRIPNGPGHGAWATSELWLY
jgi:hypothetical protein